MEKETPVFDALRLGNGLSVHFEDRSRPVAGDRWQVRLHVRVPLEIRECFFEDFPDPSEAARECAQLWPGPVEFEVVKVRNFIAREQVGSVLGAMREDFIRTGLEYLKRPNFAGNFLAKRCRELCRGRDIHNAHRDALRKADTNPG